MKTAAFVPIRLNSQRVSGKNLRPLSGSPLMCHILRTLTEVEGIDEVYVYCSDERIREFLPEGVRFLRRSEELDRDTTLGREIYDSFTAEVEADLYDRSKWKPGYDTFCFQHCFCPRFGVLTS